MIMDILSLISSFFQAFDTTLMEGNGKISSGHRGFILFHLDGESGQLVQKFQDLDTSTKMAEAFEGKKVEYGKLA